jgi:hypothetical protein
MNDVVLLHQRRLAFSFFLFFIFAIFTIYAVQPAVGFDVDVLLHQHWLKWLPVLPRYILRYIAFFVLVGT